MPNQTNPATGQDSPQDNDQTQQAGESSVGTALKEQEQDQPSAVKKEKEILSEIIRSSEAADEQLKAEVQGAIREAKLAMPEPELAPDVADSGVKAPQSQANEVVTQGTTINLPISEKEYKKGLHQKIAGVVVNKVVVGTSCLFALATWVGRLIKIAHKHTIKVIFKKGGT